MGLVRTNITIPKETLDLVDEVAGPRGRSRYIAEVVAKQVRRDHAHDVFRKYAGALKDSTAWGRTPEETDAILREVRDSSARDRMLYGDDWGGEDALPAGHDTADRPRPGRSRRPRADRVAVQRGQ